MAEIYRAKHSAHTIHDGVELFIQQGSIAEEGSPILKGREELFQALTIDFPAARTARKK